MIKTCDGRKHPEFTEQFSQRGFKVQIACVNLEILPAARKGASLSVLAWVPLLGLMVCVGDASSCHIVVIVVIIGTHISTGSTPRVSVTFLATLPPL